MLWYSLEVAWWGTSNEYPQYMFSCRNKGKFILVLVVWSCEFLWCSSSTHLGWVPTFWYSVWHTMGHSVCQSMPFLCNMGSAMQKGPLVPRLPANALTRLHMWFMITDGEALLILWYVHILARTIFTWSVLFHCVSVKLCSRECSHQSHWCIASNSALSNRLNQ